MGIELWMVFEAIAADKQGLEETMDDHVEKLESEKDIEILEVDRDEVSEVENPHPKIEKGFSTVVEIRAEVDTFSKAVSITLNYGPTYIQIEGPEKFEIDMKDAQESLQSVANTMHQYAQQGVGGVVVSKTSDTE